MAHRVLVLWPHKAHYKGEGGGFPQVWIVINLVSPCLPMIRPCNKMLQLRSNQLVWFVQVSVNNWCLSIFLVPIPKLEHAPLPPKCCKPRSVPQLFTILLFLPQTHIWVYQGAWERVTNGCSMVLLIGILGQILWVNGCVYQTTKNVVTASTNFSHGWEVD